MTATPITIELPYPPSVNGYWRTFQNRQIISAKGRKYRLDAVAAVLSQGRGKTLAGRLQVVIELFVPDRRRRDISNVIKATEDAITAAGVWKDDEQIDDLRIVRAGYEPPKGRVVLTITERAA